MKYLLQLTLCILFCSNAVAQGFDVYVSDAGDFSTGWKILQYDENGDNPEVFISDNLAWPQDIVFFEESNTVLISNLNSNKINRHNATTGAYIDNFATGISGPTRTKIGPDGLLYVLQWAGTGKVKRYQLDGTYVDDFTNVGVTQAIGLDWDSAGNLYVSSFSGDMVRRFDTSGNDVGMFINTNLLGPTNIWFDDSGDLLVSDYNGTAVKRFSATGVYKSDFLTGLNKSEGYAHLPNGNILIGNGANSTVKMFDGAGNFIEDFVSSGSGNLIAPNAVVIRNRAFKMNAGLNDAWFDPATDGQGFFVTVFPDVNLVTIAWFTYDTELPGSEASANLGDPGHRWLTALGPIEGNKAVMPISIASGGIFDTGTDIERKADGTITLTFKDCDSGTVDYDITSIDRQGSVPIVRVAGDNRSLCNALQ